LQDLSVDDLSVDGRLLLKGILYSVISVDWVLLTQPGTVAGSVKTAMNLPVPKQAGIVAGPVKAAMNLQVQKQAGIVAGPVKTVMNLPVPKEAEIMAVL
jgi:hypothetical protein